MLTLTPDGGIPVINMEKGTKVVNVNGAEVRVTCLMSGASNRPPWVH